MDKSREKPNVRVRHSLIKLANDYKSGADKASLENVVRAFRGIQKLKPDDEYSFFKVAGYHGLPYRGAGQKSSSYWGGYCNHGTILFLPWHRFYVLRMENALRTIKGCENVTLPFWDYTSVDNPDKTPIPWPLTVAKFRIPKNTDDILYDGEKEVVIEGKTFIQLSNPLRSYVLQRAIHDADDNDTDSATGATNLGPDSKPKGYRTVRYPLSGLVSTPFKAWSDDRNSQFPDRDVNTDMLNRNVWRWLGVDPRQEGPMFGIAEEIRRSLQAPNYVVFSNTTSSAEWNANLAPGVQAVYSLEKPHNAVHLSVGGFLEAPPPKAATQKYKPGWHPLRQSFGDMGDNGVASFDPIFFFHHCNIDRLFWLWQFFHGQTTDIEIPPGMEDYPGTNSSDDTGGLANASFSPNVWLNLDSPLRPFLSPNDPQGKTFATFRECISVIKLGFTYNGGTHSTPESDAYGLDPTVKSPPADLSIVKSDESDSGSKIHLSNIDRAQLEGSFVIHVYSRRDAHRLLRANKKSLKNGKNTDPDSDSSDHDDDDDDNGRPVQVAREEVLSRWSIKHCRNCQTYQKLTFVHQLPYALTKQNTDDLFVTIQAANFKEMDIDVPGDTEKHTPGQVAHNVALKLL